MLGKLSKYEFKAIGRILLPLYGAFMIVSVLFGISLRSGETHTAENIMYRILSFMTTALFLMIAITIFVMTVIILIQRFYKNLLGNEGYLCFALPVKTSAHLLNKTLSALIWTALGAISGLLSAAIIALITAGPKSFFSMLGKFMQTLTNELSLNPSSNVIVFIECILLLLLGFAEAALKIYAAISLGQQWSKHRVMGAIGAYIGFGILETILINIFMSKGISSAIESFIELADTPFWGGQLTILLLFIAEAFLIAAYWLVSYLLLDRRLNLQ